MLIMKNNFRSNVDQNDQNTFLGMLLNKAQVVGVCHSLSTEFFLLEHMFALGIICLETKEYFNAPCSLLPTHSLLNMSMMCII